MRTRSTYRLSVCWFSFLCLAVSSLNDLGSSVFAGGVSLYAEETTVEVGQACSVVIRVEGSFEGEPSLPAVQGMEVLGQSTSSQTSIVNGSISSSKEFNYEVVFSTPAEYTIPGIQLKIDGQAVTSNALKINVVKNLSSAGASSSGQGGDASSFVELTVSHQEAYVGEVVIVSAKVYSSGAFIGLDPKIADSKQFRRIPITEKLEQKKEVRDGKPYFVIEFSYLLIPKSKGDLSLPTPEFDATVEDLRPRQRRGQGGFFDQDFFSGRRGVRRKIVSEPTKIKVKELPRPVPKSFSGVVGQFTAQVIVPKKQGKVGDSFDIKLKIEGQGDLEGVTSLSSHWDATAFQVYDSKPKIVQSVGTTTGLVADGTFEYALIPKEAGSFKLKLPTLGVFSPELGQFVDIAAEDVEIVVEPNQQAGALVKPDNGTGRENEVVDEGASSNRGQSTETVVGRSGFPPIYLGVETKFSTLLASTNRIWLVGGLLNFILFALAIPWINILSKLRGRQNKIVPDLKQIEMLNTLPEIRNWLDRYLRRNPRLEETLTPLRQFIDEVLYSSHPSQFCYEEAVASLKLRLCEIIQAKARNSTGEVE